MGTLSKHTYSFFILASLITSNLAQAEYKISSSSYMSGTTSFSTSSSQSWSRASTSFTPAYNYNHTHNIDELDRRERRNDKRHRAGIAGATAVAFLQRANQGGKQLVSMSAGHYRDESAVAIGYSRASDDNKVSVAVGSAFNSRGNANLGGSIGYQW